MKTQFKRISSKIIIGFIAITTISIIINFITFLLVYNYETFEKIYQLLK
jgi:hypothetical protein